MRYSTILIVRLVLSVLASILLMIATLYKYRATHDCTDLVLLLLGILVLFNVFTDDARRYIDYYY